jgi:hypothetical protein
MEPEETTVVDNGSVNTFPLQRIHNRKTVARGVFYVVRAEANPQFVVKEK